MPTAPSPLDPRAEAVADRLHRLSRRQLLPAALPMVARGLRQRLRTGSWDTTQTPEGRAFLADKLVALDPHKAALCYLMSRSIEARTMVEVGTSHGASTLYLAASARDTVATKGGSAQVIGTEVEPVKVRHAQENLRDAGLSEWAEIREGDLRQTLTKVPAPIDFVLIDIWIPMALPALELLLPSLRPGALVVCDAVVSGAKEYADYLTLVRAAAGPFTGVTVPGRGGLEISMRR